MRTANFVPIDAELLKPPKGFVAAGPLEERRFNDARYVTHVQVYVKPFRSVAPGMLLVGEERRRVFVGGMPTGVLLPPHLLSDLGPRWSARGLAWSEEGLCKLDNGGLSGDPTTFSDGSRVRAFGWQLPLLPVESAWAEVQAVLGLGFSGADLDTFATAGVACVNYLRESALGFVTRYLGLVHPRERLAVYRRGAAVLSGFSKSEASSAEARPLFDEALLEGVTAATAPGLVALVETLTAVEGAASEAG